MMLLAVNGMPQSMISFLTGTQAVSLSFQARLFWPSVVFVVWVCMALFMTWSHVPTEIQCLAVCGHQRCLSWPRT